MGGSNLTGLRSVRWRLFFVLAIVMLQLTCYHPADAQCTCCCLTKCNNCCIWCSCCGCQYPGSGQGCPVCGCSCCTSVAPDEGQLLSENGDAIATNLTISSMKQNTATALISAQVGKLCFISHSNPGDIDYPWSAATSVHVVYNNIKQFTDFGVAVSILSGTGTRTFTNKFGVSFVTPLTIAPGSLLYLNSTYPVDDRGLKVVFPSPIQLPGGDLTSLVSTLTVYNDSGMVVEGTSYRINSTGSAFLSNVPGFVNVTIGTSDVNALDTGYSACEASVTLLDGLQQLVHPSVFKSGSSFQYSYFISDGASYSVVTNLSLTAASPFPVAVNDLGILYQVVVKATGTRKYTYLPTGKTVISSITGISETAISDQRFYPYANLLGSSVGVYTPNTAPFLDAEGLDLAISPPTPRNGVAPGMGEEWSSIRVFLSDAQQDSQPILTEGMIRARRRKGRPDPTVVRPPALLLQEQYFAV